jgi:hypothetical protein
MERTELKLKPTSRQKKPITETRPKGGFFHFNYWKLIYMKFANSRYRKISLVDDMLLSLFTFYQYN